MPLIIVDAVSHCILDKDLFLDSNSSVPEGNLIQLLKPKKGTNLFFLIAKRLYCIYKLILVKGSSIKNGGLRQSVLFHAREFTVVQATHMLW